MTVRTRKPGVSSWQSSLSSSQRWTRNCGQSTSTRVRPPGPDLLPRPGGARRGRVVRGAHDGEPLVDVQLAGLAVGADAVEVVEPVGDVAALLHLVDQHPRAHGVHLAGVDHEEVVLGHRHGDQAVHQGPVDQRLAQVVGGVGGVPEDQRGVVAGRRRPASTRPCPAAGPPTHGPGRRRGAPGPTASPAGRGTCTAAGSPRTPPARSPARPSRPGASVNPSGAPEADEPAHPRHPGDRPALPDDPRRGPPRRTTPAASSRPTAARRTPARRRATRALHAPSGVESRPGGPAGAGRDVRASDPTGPGD